MQVIFTISIFVSLTLIAIVIAVFVFASSFYKGALELSSKEEEDALNRRKELINRKRQEFIKKIRGVNEKDFSEAVRTELDKFDSELKDIDQSMLKSRNRPKALGVKNIVGIPASFLVASIVTSGVAIATSGTLPTIMFAIPLTLIGISSYFIIKNLLIIESFSKVTDLGTLMERALDRHMAKRQPIVDIDIYDFTLEIEQGKTQEIIYDVHLKQGTIGRNTKVRFSGTEELDFPDEKIEQLEYDYKNMKKPKQFYHELGDINPEVYRQRKFKVKAPDKPGKYTMAYWLRCDEYTRDETTFKVKVV